MKRGIPLSATLSSHRRLLTFLVVAIMVLPSTPLALAGSDWTRTGTGFDVTGVTKSDITIGAGGITLAQNASRLDDWTNVTGSQGPSPRYGHAMAYDSDTGQVVIFGGVMNGGPSYNETWVFDPSTNKWSNVTPKVSPPDRWGHGMVYLPDKKVFIMFGGQNYGGALMDIWQYDIGSNKWQQRAGNGFMGPRSKFAMAYDPDQQVVVLVGGMKFGPTVELNETAVYYYHNDTWARMASLPADGRDGCAMTYDSDNKGMLFYGGYIGSSYYGDTWFYNTSTDKWSARDLATSNIPAMFGMSMAYDGKKRAAALFGGYQAVGPSSQNRLWYFNSTDDRWQLAMATNTPKPREEAGMAYLPKSDELVMFGGMDENGKMFSDTWIYDMKLYYPSGSYISEPLDMKWNATFGKVVMTSSFPTGTEGGVRIRTGATNAELLTKNFTGPGGSAGTYYMSNETIDAFHNGARWLQYKVILSTTAPSVTPSVSSVAIRYNLIQDLTLKTPAGGENWTGVQNISWDASDRDNDGLLYDVQLVKDSLVEKTLATNLLMQYYLWDTNSTANGTYQVRVIAKDNNTAMPVSVNRTSADFQIFHPKPNSRPIVTLLSPANGITTIRPEVRLRWSGHDDDGDQLTYYVHLDAFGGSTLVNVTKTTEYYATGLLDNTTYLWSVTASDGKLNGSSPVAWTFKVKVNHPPVFTSAPVKSVYAGLPYTYDANASDQDILDALQFSLPVAPLGMTIDKVSGQIIWSPNASMIGDHPVRVNVTDGLNNVSQDFVLTVSKLPPGFNRPPRFTSTPVITAMVGYKYAYQVTAMDPDEGDKLTYIIQEGPVTMTIDSKTGLIEWVPDYRYLGKNYVNIEVYDTKAWIYQSFNITVTVSPLNHPPNINSQPQTTKVIAGKKWIYHFNVSDPDNDPVVIKIQGNASDAPYLGGEYITWTLKKAGTYTLIINASDGKGGFDNQIITVKVVNPPGLMSLGNPFYLLLIVLIVVMIVVAIVAAVLVGKRRKAQAEAAAQLNLIDDIFLIYRDGRLISHHTRKLKPDVDDQVLTGMFTAVTDFIKSSFGGDDSKAVNEIAYGNDRILLEHGRYIYIAAVVSGQEFDLKAMHARMRTAVDNIEAEFAGVLQGWEGDVKALEGAKKWVQTLISSK